MLDRQDQLQFMTDKLGMLLSEVESKSFDKDISNTLEDFWKSLVRQKIREKPIDMDKIIKNTLNPVS